MQAEEQTERDGRYQRLFEKAPEPYLLTDHDGRIKLANERAAELLGVDAGELPGSAVAEHLAPDQAEALADTLERVRRGDRVSAWEVRLRDGASEPHALVSIEPAGTEEEEELRWVLWDALPLQLVRERLHQLIELSKDDAAALRALAEWQASLLGSAAQDMRTPLRVISSTIGSLLEAPAPGDDPATRAMLERAAEQVVKLQRLLPTLLQLGRVQLREPTGDRQVLHLRRVVDEALHHLDPVGHRITYDFAVEHIEGDPLQLARVVVELVTHAADHGPDEAGLTIGTTARGVDVELFLDVPGYHLAEDVRDVLFAPFMSARRNGAVASRDDLGLSLVSVFARMHGGRAWVQDGPEGGVSFRVLLSNALPDRRGGAVDGP